MKIYRCSLGGLSTRTKLGKLEPTSLHCSRLVSQGVAEGESLRRVNQLGIQMLSKPLYQQVFPGGKGNVFSVETVEKSIDHLKKHVVWGDQGNTFPDIDVKLPPLYGRNIDEHFRIIASVQSQDYLNLAMQLVRTKLQPMPQKWSMEEGWTKYDPRTGEAKHVACPADNAIVFDVETCTRDSQRPILAVAVSPRAWYSWVSKRLSFSQDFFSKDEIQRCDLIPLECPRVEGGKAGSDWSRSRLVVGHNVSYDRARIKEQYYIKVSASRLKECVKNYLDV